jgi:hypothetical protein
MSINEAREVCDIIKCGIDLIRQKYRYTYPNTNSKLLSNLLKPYEKLLNYICPQNIDKTYIDEYHETEPEYSKLRYLHMMKGIYAFKLLYDSLIEDLRYEHEISISEDDSNTSCEVWYIRAYNKQIWKIVNSKSTQT